MNEYIQQFRNYLILTKKSSKNTTESYLRDLNQFKEYCISNNLYDIKKIKSSSIQAYIDYLSLAGKSTSTISRTTASLRGFFKYLIITDVINKNPVESIKKEKNRQKLPEILNKKEILALLSQPDNNDYKSIRDKAILEILYATGIKVSELIELKTNNVNTHLGIIHLQNNKKERIIPIYPGAVQTLINYIQNVRPAVVTDNNIDNLFTNMNGHPLTRQGIWKIIKQYVISADIKKEVTPHTLRHSFAAHLIENGADLKDIKEMLGHSDISSTQIYAQLIKSKYTNKYAKFHPLAK